MPRVQLLEKLHRRTAKHSQIITILVTIGMCLLAMRLLILKVLIFKMWKMIIPMPIQIMEDIPMDIGM